MFMRSAVVSGISPLEVLLRVGGSCSITETNISVSGSGATELLVKHTSGRIRGQCNRREKVLHYSKYHRQG